MYRPRLKRPCMFPLRPEVREPILIDGSDYALQITQGQSEINSSGLFSIVGGAGTSSISYSGFTPATGSFR